MSKIIFNKDYCGFEDICDLDRDISEAFDRDFNPEMKNIPLEFMGTMRVTIEYFYEGETFDIV